MDQAAATRFVANQLVKNATRDDVVYKLCQLTNWPWPEAEKFVAQVELQQRAHSVRVPVPVLLILAIGTVILGLGLLAYCILYFLDSAQPDLNRLTVFSAYRMIDDFSFRDHYRTVIAFVTGCAMLILGAAGLSQATRAER